MPRDELERYVRQAINDFDAGMEMLKGCGDNSCYIRPRTSRKGGMGTNGGCRCGRDAMTSQRFIGMTMRLVRDIESALAEQKS